MQTWALITAAAPSLQTGDFRAMEQIGSITMAQRIIATLQQAGIEKTVMVTGLNAVTLERHLAGNGIIFLRNEAYEASQMFDSVKIGLEYLQGKCDRVVFTPVDVPLFTAQTVKTLLDSDVPLACPVCQNRGGHPLLISSRLIPEILRYTGGRGLRGAVAACSEPLLRIPVEDPGTLHGAEHSQALPELLHVHNAQLVRPLVHLSLTREKPFFDEQVAMLLQLVEETRSVRLACSRMQISYSTGWNLIRTLESQLPYPLLLRTQGGPGGSQSCLTEQGQQLLERYNDYRAALQTAAKDLYDQYFGSIL